MSSEAIGKLLDLNKDELFKLLVIIDQLFNDNTLSVDQLIVQSLAELIPFDSYILGLDVEADSTPDGRYRQLLCQGFPSDWLNHYLDNQYTSIDPLIQYHLSNLDAKVWTTHDLSNMERNQRSEAITHICELGHKNRIIFGFHDPTSNSFGYGCFSAREFGQDQRHRVLLNYLRPFLFEALSMRIRPPTLNEGDMAPTPKLSKRELDILRLIIEGKFNSQISDILHISERTVKFHSHNIMRKLGANSRAHATALALQKRLV